VSQISARPRKIEGGYAHWCPGCQELHAIAVETPQRNGARWTFDGNAETPTFSPSVNISWGWPDQPQGQGRCHYFVTKGKLLFCSDSTHALAGQTVPLPDLPSHLTD
jgi:hypothetical protein